MSRPALLRSAPPSRAPQQRPRTVRELEADYEAWLAAGAHRSGPDPLESRDPTRAAPGAPALLSAFSADLECPHGNVPATQPPRCGCRFDEAA